ncbi:glycan-binding surface protein [Catalinimonas niigatensis]|uniref:glycan-binding surface protein n=1 Tax=Catalinimonas niigatensis TaxID=1397264 RepID=UPI0026668F25|nr:glycan-binding surface protein [Catalinimonas niigatensis]WPP50709.1 glycan-binding surface protein [Catalinimonas niigatensis]
MKHIQSIYSVTRSGLLIILIAALGLLSACEDDDMSTGAPIIERVRLTDPTTADSSFISATLGSTLAIIGQNLGSAEYVYINGYQIRVNSAYATERNLIISILDSVPTIATNPDVPNTLRVVSPYGEATYDFQTLPPAPIIEQVANQYVRAGETLRLYGRYFYFVDTVYLPGDIAVTEGITANGRSLSLTVPEGLDFSGGNYVQVVTQSGTSNINRESQLFDGSGIVSNFDDTFPWGWGINIETSVTTTAPNIQPIENNFALVNMSVPGNYGWSNDKVINMVDWGGAQIYPTAPSAAYDPSLPIADFDARFEVAVSSSASLEGIELQMMYQDANNVELTANVPMTNFIRTQDGSWYTVSIPLNELANGTSTLDTYADILTGNANGEHHFRIVVVNTTANDVPVTIAIDNVRVVNAEMEE